MRYVFNQKEFKNRRRLLRRNMPLPEYLLWDRIRNGQLDGYRFRRQYGVGRFIIDFYCPKASLAIEIDGASHYTNSGQARDKSRGGYFNQFNIKVIRFTNKEVTENITGVVQIIMEALVSTPTNSP